MATYLYFRVIKLVIFFFIFNYNLYGSDNMIVANINSSEAYNLYNKNELIIVDVRTKTEWKKTGIIANSFLLSMHDENYIERENFIKEVKNVLDKNKDKNISFICASGARSEIVANYFLKAGYKNIFNISDGVLGINNNGWFYLGFPLESYLEN